MVGHGDYCRYYCVRLSFLFEYTEGMVVVSLRVLVSTLWLLHCLPLACGRRRSLREDEPLSSRSCVYFLRGFTLFVVLWMGLVCVPEGGV